MKRTYPKSKKQLVNKTIEPSLFNNIQSIEPLKITAKTECKIFTLENSEYERNKKLYDRILKLSSHLFDD
jgi:hypothetical protein